MAEGPPGVTGVFPMRDEVLAYLPTIVVEFWEAVTGVAAGDLTVNGSPATHVQAHSASSYVFWGFADPGPSSTPATVAVALAAGAIQDGGGAPFPGTTWSYTVDVDQDADGIPDVRDNCPTTPNADQTNSSRLLIHGSHYGDAHDPTIPLGRPGHAEGDACSNDDDGDGIDDATEATNGTDPTNYYDPYVCPFDDPPKIEPGPCGCGWLDTLDGNGQCVLALECGTLDCDDGDACTVDGCTSSQGCVRHEEARRRLPPRRQGGRRGEGEAAQALRQGGVEEVRRGRPRREETRPEGEALDRVRRRAARPARRRAGPRPAAARELSRPATAGRGAAARNPPATSSAPPLRM
jgi:hypothetical protein